MGGNALPAGYDSAGSLALGAFAVGSIAVLAAFEFIVIKDLLSPSK